MNRPALTGIERLFEPHELIVSKTDDKGRILYANRVFQRISGFSERDLRGSPHNIVRHPDMPRAVFKLLWETLMQGDEVFAYVINRSRNGDHYWVLAHVTPSFSPSGTIIGLHSSRRVPERGALAAIEPLYRELAAIEAANDNRGAGLKASFDALMAQLASTGKSYDEFVLSL